MERDPENQTRWKQKWRWHNRGNVWDKTVTDRAGKEEWMGDRTVESTLADVYKLVTLVNMLWTRSTEEKLDLTVVVERGDCPSDSED